MKSLLWVGSCLVRRSKPNVCYALKSRRIFAGGDCRVSGCNRPQALIPYKKLGGKQQYGRKIVIDWRQFFSRDTGIRLIAKLIRVNVALEL